ncbi:hypothetical protein [Muricoccus radiodurans]|uniref:hypothetical protein n=1 Tax=Muricoccus radiodurans TaxID=2231721 RepID=UPI003CF45A12
MRRAAPGPHAGDVVDPAARRAMSGGMDHGSATPSPALLDALWRVVERHGWHGTTFARIAAESGETLESLRGHYATPVDLLRAHARVVDQAVLAGTVPGQAGFGTARDRIFDLLMRRFDALAPHRAGILRLQRDLMTDPVSALLLSPILMASMAWTLEGADVPTGGITGLLRVKGLTAVWLSASRTWASDESTDLGATMAALDRALDQAEKVARTLRLDGHTTEPGLGTGGTPVAGADAVPPDVVEEPAPPDAGIGPDVPGQGGTVAGTEAPSAPVPPAGPTPPAALGPEAPGEGPGHLSGRDKGPGDEPLG